MRLSFSAESPVGESVGKHVGDFYTADSNPIRQPTPKPNFPTHKKINKNEILKTCLSLPLMLKKRTAILLLTIACATLLGHNIFPHHHDTDHDLTVNHQTSHHHDSEEDSGDLNHLFSHFIHSADDITFLNNHNISNTFSKQLLSIVAVLPDYFFPDKFLIPSLLNKPPAEYFIYISPHSLSSGLRAPPVFIS